LAAGLEAVAVEMAAAAMVVVGSAEVG